MNVRIDLCTLMGTFFIKFHVCSTLVFVSMFYLLFGGKSHQNGSKNKCPGGGAPKIDPGAHVDFWMHFGCLLAPFWLPLAPFGSLLAPFGTFWLPFGAPWLHFLQLLKPFAAIRLLFYRFDDFCIPCASF